VVISGGTTGIGRATAKLLVSQGAKVFLFGRHEEALPAALDEIRSAAAEGARGGEAFGTVADQSRSEDVQRVFREADERLGGCNILVNNAAVSGGSVAKRSLDEIRYVVETNLLGYMTCAHEALQRMQQARTAVGGGHIVNIGSMSADLREPGSEVYVATKAGIQAFSESLRKTANKEGIRVTLIEPGAVATPIQEKSPEEEKRKIDAMEMLLPGDIARCVLWCLQQPARCDVVSVQIRPVKQLI
jgi:NADP-dependent 3-hydroxy acid dehydrogenase YdfG